MVRTAVVILLLLSSSSLRVYGAPSSSEAGIGILLIDHSKPVDAAGDTFLTLYAQPGVRKVAEVNPTDIPSPFSVSDPSSGEIRLLVSGKKNEWLKIIYDDAGREAWVKLRRPWHYASWSSLLKGRKVGMLPKLRQSDYLIRKQPSVTSLPLGTLGTSQVLQVVEVNGDWVKVEVSSIGSGYIRWRGDDGRMTISARNVVP